MLCEDGKGVKAVGFLFGALFGTLTIGRLTIGRLTIGRLTIGTIAHPFSPFPQLRRN
jgi:hypothetical protein